MWTIQGLGVVVVEPNRFTLFMKRVLLKREDLTLHVGKEYPFSKYYACENFDPDLVCYMKSPSRKL